MTGGQQSTECWPSLERKTGWRGFKGKSGGDRASQGVILREAVLQSRLELSDGGVVKEQSTEISKLK